LGAFPISLSADKPQSGCEHVGVPMKPQEEKYVHFVTCIDCLNSAWRTLSAIRESPHNRLSVPAFRFAVIEYAKPFKQSIGMLENNKGKPIRYQIKDDHIPEHHRELHTRLLSLRDQVLAHSDLTVLEASVHLVETNDRQRALIAQNTGLGDEEFGRIEEIIQLIEESLVRMDTEVKRLESALQRNQ